VFLVLSVHVAVCFVLAVQSAYPEGLALTEELGDVEGLFERLVD
jgi:hypothetical protein